MARLHLIEIHEQPWCPTAIRDGATDYLRFTATIGQQYQNVIPLLKRALEMTKGAPDSQRIVDLCSGGGGPWPQLYGKLNAVMPNAVPILLTDLYPNRAVRQMLLPPQIRFLPTAVDATQIPADLNGFRTLFTAFHHFPPSRARAILQDAVNSGQGIGIFEQTARSPIAVLMMLFLPLISILAAPFVRPFRLTRLFWTWVIPLIPLVFCFDGIVSCLRTYSVAELQAMVAVLGPPPADVDYRWEIGCVPSPISPIGVTYAIGYPTRPDVHH